MANFGSGKAVTAFLDLLAGAFVAVVVERALKQDWSNTVIPSIAGILIFVAARNWSRVSKVMGPTFSRSATMVATDFRYWLAAIFVGFIYVGFPAVWSALQASQAHPTLAAQQPAPTPLGKSVPSSKTAAGATTATVPASKKPQGNKPAKVSKSPIPQEAVTGPSAGLSEHSRAAKTEAEVQLDALSAALKGSSGNVTFRWSLGCTTCENTFRGLKSRFEAEGWVVYQTNEPRPLSVTTLGRFIGSARLTLRCAVLEAQKKKTLNYAFTTAKYDFDVVDGDYSQTSCEIEIRS